MRIRILKEVGLNNPNDYTRGTTDVLVTFVHSDGTEETQYDDDRTSLASESCQPEGTQNHIKVRIKLSDVNAKVHDNDNKMDMLGPGVHPGSTGSPCGNLEGN